MALRIPFSLAQLEYFVTAASFQSMAQAAKRLNVTQPNLTIQIRKLEELLGVHLVDRSEKPFKLTQAGQELLPQMNRIVEQAYELYQMAQVLGNQTLSAKIRIGIIPTVGTRLIEQLEEFWQQYKNAKVQFLFQELETSKILMALDQGQLDWGILATPIEGVQFHYQHLFFEPFYIVLRKDHPLAEEARLDLEQLQKEPLWLLPDDHCLRQQVLDLCRQRYVTQLPQLGWEAANFDGIFRLIERWGGFTVVPELFVSIVKSYRKLVVKPLKRPAFRQISIMYKQPVHHLIVLENFVKFFQKRSSRRNKQSLSVIPVRLEK